VCDLWQFVTVHQNLLSVVSEKHSILAQFGVTAPVAAVLRTSEGGIDVSKKSLVYNRCSAVLKTHVSTEICVVVDPSDSHRG